MSPDERRSALLQISSKIGPGCLETYILRIFKTFHNTDNYEKTFFGSPFLTFHLSHVGLPDIAILKSLDQWFTPQYKKTKLLIPQYPAVVFLYRVYMFLKCWQNPRSRFHWVVIKSCFSVILSCADKSGDWVVCSVTSQREGPSSNPGHTERLLSLEFCKFARVHMAFLLEIRFSSHSPQDCVFSLIWRL